LTDKGKAWIHIFSGK